MADTQYWVPQKFKVPRLVVFGKTGNPREYIIDRSKYMGRATAGSGFARG